ncbi:para-aminobenzoate synthase glutamine amidotransferase component II [Candidatus Blochmanniella vafra str. BVAF]|uniref:Aminodeoxychorismate synthase component 2 n=1 Tax=Blochmanniella vafra (strain BVAF) TaxID=859654 RepID=E8Q6H9_BLOVB|nr:aminodeoxychorismate/anthranilate synthase component II [Candidatus Blochmannia vafer]ADV33948.1 para-aminobenzoate synthase glutamine amidotransferase component II [Candidatus Blochmannia vafer str. BVAF]
MNKILIIDNYDSFTWNLYQYFREMGGMVEVRRHDSISVLDLDHLTPDRLVISPGPGTPGNSGISLQALSYFCNRIPIFGVCLGHQVIAQFFGAKLKCAQSIMHGKSSIISHNNKGVFCGLMQSLRVIRYHSLVVDLNSVPVSLEITAWSTCSSSQGREIMGIRHRSLLIEGVQFHPESVLTEQGYEMLFNFMLY